MGDDHSPLPDMNFDAIAKFLKDARTNPAQLHNEEFEQVMFNQRLDLVKWRALVESTESEDIRRVAREAVLILEEFFDEIARIDAMTDVNEVIAYMHDQSE